MELKDLPDSELPFMESIFMLLVDSGSVSPDDVVRAKKNLPATEVVQLSEEEFREIYEKLTLFADWGFGHMSGRRILSIGRFADQHRPLKWHRDQAILKCEQDRISGRKQTTSKWINNGSLIVSLLLSLLAFLYTIYQGEESKKDKSSLQRLEERTQQVEDRLLLVESQVAYLLLGRSLPTTTHQSHFSDSSTSSKGTIFSKDQKVDSLE